MPKSIEHYQQETGRAGRDGLEAECVLLYSASDTFLWKSMIDKPNENGEKPDPDWVASATRHVIDLDRYCSGTVCRHRALVEYFGQAFDKESCNACDICLGETEDVADALTIAQKILSCVYRLNQSWGVGHVISVLRGERTEKIRDRGHESLSTHGILKDSSRNEIRDWIWQLIGQGYLTQTDDQYPILHLTSSARVVLRGDAVVRLRQPIVTATKKRSVALDDAQPYDQSLFDVLRKWRRGEAEERRVPPYVIFSDRTLREIARARPATLVELREVYGVGDAKLEAFGSAVLNMLTATPV